MIHLRSDLGDIMSPTASPGRYATLCGQRVGGGSLAGSIYHITCPSCIASVMRQIETAHRNMSNRN